MRAVYKDTMNVSGLIDHAQKLVDLGYTAFKVVFIPFTHYTVLNEDLKLVHSLMSSLRNKVGDNIKIMVDFHGRCGSGISAIQYIKDYEVQDILKEINEHNYKQNEIWLIVNDKNKVKKNDRASQS